jgi:transcriptional regulator with XRE-family HTH domain
MTAANGAAPLNQGARRLAKWLERQGITQETLGGLLGVDQGHVSKWVRGVVVPRAPTRIRVRTITAGAVYWYEKERAP